MVDGARLHEIEDRFFSELQQREAIVEQRFARRLERIEGLLRKLEHDEASSSLTTLGANRTEVRAPHHTAVTRVSKTDFPCFDGEDVEDWIFRCNQLFELDDVAEELKIQQASVHLEEPALSWHKRFRRDYYRRDRLTWSDYCYHIVERFGRPLDSSAALKNMKQDDAAVGNFSVYARQDRLLQSNAKVSSENVSTSILHTSCSTKGQNYTHSLVEEICEKESVGHRENLGRQTTWNLFSEEDNKLSHNHLLEMVDEPTEGDINCEGEINCESHSLECAWASRSESPHAIHSLLSPTINKGISLHFEISENAPLEKANNSSSIMVPKLSHRGVVDETVSDEVRFVPLLERGRKALEEINQETGLAFNERDLQYYTQEAYCALWSFPLKDRYYEAMAGAGGDEALTTSFNSALATSIVFDRSYWRAHFLIEYIILRHSTIQRSGQG